MRVSYPVEPRLAASSFSDGSRLSKLTSNTPSVKSAAVWKAGGTMPQTSVSDPPSVCESEMCMELAAEEGPLSGLPGVAIDSLVRCVSW